MIPQFAIGIDLGGSSVKGVSIRGEKTVAELNVPFEAARERHWLEVIHGVLAVLESKERAQFIGISAPGLAAQDGRSIACMPGRLQGLEHLDWTNELARSNVIPVLNDAHAALLGESWCGAARSYRHVFMLTLGTGVGGAAMVDGKLLRGAMGRGGHLGHACLDIDGPSDCAGMPGSLEVAIGNCTITERSQGRFATTHDLIRAYEKGDEFAAAIWLKSVRALACATASFVNILDSEAAIIGGGIARAGNSLFEPLEKFLREVEWHPTGARVKIIPAMLGEFAGAYGAAWNAREMAR